MEHTRITIAPSTYSIEANQIEAKQEIAYKGLGVGAVKMLHTRELCGNVTTSAKGKYNFREEYTKRLVSEPKIWRYGDRSDYFIRALEQVDIIANTSDGDIRADLLISGDYQGFVSFHVVREVIAQSPGSLWTLDGASFRLSSRIGCIKKLGNLGQHKILITSGPSVHVLSLSDPLVLHSSDPKIVENFSEIASCRSFIQAADCNSNGSRALIGTYHGAALVNVETGALSWACHWESNVRSVQLDYSEKIALCGLENGVIVSVDTRQRPDSQTRLPRQHILLKSNSSTGDTRDRWFELSGDIYPSGTIATRSSNTCMTSLKLYHQYYFLASSLDGTIKLYDHRMVQRGAVLSYKGNAAHRGIEHAVDPSERFVLSGGIDRRIRLWNIMSGELLSEKLFMRPINSNICWGKKEDNCPRVRKIYNQHSYFGEAWFGAVNSLYSVTW